MMALEVLGRYIEEPPAENFRMFEELDKQGKGTYFYPWWGKARSGLKDRKAVT